MFTSAFRMSMTASTGVSYETEAATYFAAIATAGSTITTANKAAVNAFIAGCKADGIWNAIKASCLLAGPDSLAGALVPLVGTAPTNNGPFVPGDYSRTTGLIGNGTSKFLDTGIAHNTIGSQNSFHYSVWQTAEATRNTNRAAIGAAIGSSALLVNSTTRFYRVNSGTSSLADTGNKPGFWGASRAASTGINSRVSNTDTPITVTSNTPSSLNEQVFAASGLWFSDARLSFYSIGESLNLALLNARLTTYMAALT